MPRLPLLAAQVVAYMTFMGIVGYLSASPEYQHAEPGEAMVKLVFRHATTRVEACRTLSQEELAELAPNMRNTLECPRERHPIGLELSLDGAILYRGIHQSTGLWKDGPASVYEKFAVAPGAHDLTVRFSDTGRTSGFDYTRTETIDLQPGQNFVIDFRSNTGFRFPGEQGR